MLAFDLILSDDTSLLSPLLLCLLAKIIGYPYDTLKTEQEYHGLFVLAGYEAKNTELRDISELVFASLSQFLEHRKKTLENFGRGLGKLNAARWLFGWWSRRGIVRGFIVVGGK